MSIDVILSNFQSFDEEGAGINDVKRINILVGSNNAGKSKILKAVSRTISLHKDCLLNSENMYSVRVSRKISERELRRLFKEGYSQGGIPGGDHWLGFGIYCQETRITFSITPGDAILENFLPVYNGPEYETSYNKKSIDILKDELKKLITIDSANTFPNNIYMMNAERDIKPEGASNTGVVQPDGQGITDIIRSYLISSDKNSEPVEKHLLSGLNEIFNPEYVFNRITIQ